MGQCVYASVKKHYKSSLPGLQLTCFFLYFCTPNSNNHIRMKAYIYQTSFYYLNKIHDFHAWGVAAQI